LTGARTGLTQMRGNAVKAAFRTSCRYHAPADRNPAVSGQLLECVCVLPSPQSVPLTAPDSVFRDAGDRDAGDAGDRRNVPEQCQDRSFGTPFPSYTRDPQVAMRREGPRPPGPS
jgi:hypothetical protein